MAQGGSSAPYRASLLLRLVDDFLFITTVKEAAAAVAERMLQGATARQRHGRGRLALVLLWPGMERLSCAGACGHECLVGSGAARCSQQLANNKIFPKLLESMSSGARGCLQASLMPMSL